VVKAIHQVGPRLFNIHMKDLTNFSDRESQVAVGDGKMPVRDIFQALLAVNYTGFVDLEYEVHPDDPMPGVIASYAYMHGMLDAMTRSTAATRRKNEAPGVSPESLSTCDQSRETATDAGAT